MKKYCLFAAFAAFAALCVADEKTQTPAPAADSNAPAAAVCPAAARPACPAPVPACEASAAKTDEGVDFRLSRIARGFTNIATCPLEMPRCMILGNSAVPFWGFVAGAVDGIGTTGMRAFSGVTDVLFFGFDAGTVYNDDFREFVWESRWQQPKKQVKTTNVKS